MKEKISKMPIILTGLAFEIGELIFAWLFLGLPYIAYIRAFITLILITTVLLKYYSANAKKFNYTF